ncbi:50S ribosomal protein L18 [Desulfurispirillum indicum]|uniref:Large ribosomal subunit protein uL18 n=1 Tax=Desulfurispirillum indicum (strain ATCC BAA-1389 / DSM 22839 / S5) TaxID=653733 RepID=E6W726_DESIS|nr:50S ribosomal protein L18 [Desulfurispirillum indicum]ADU65104.1 ribosomal protein L18 [Desulfurispirillum indicum S5]UCZ57008.1 50S ribosomal protein L18 [Desulfurispirillum indicum]
MAKTSNTVIRRQARHRRVRKKVQGSTQRPRLAVFRSNSHIYAQIIDDAQGITLAAASSLSKELESLQNGGNIEAAKQVGALLARKAKEQNIESVVFDRGGFIYHGRVQALAEAARENGLKF